MADSLSRDDFDKCLTDKFQCEFSVGILTKVDLLEVSEIKIIPGQESNSLIFLTPKEVPTEPNTY